MQALRLRAAVRVRPYVHAFARSVHVDLARSLLLALSLSLSLSLAIQFPRHE